MRPSIGVAGRTRTRTSTTRAGKQKRKRSSAPPSPPPPAEQSSPIVSHRPTIGRGSSAPPQDSVTDVVDEDDEDQESEEEEDGDDDEDDYEVGDGDGEDDEDDDEYDEEFEIEEECYGVPYPSQRHRQPHLPYTPALARSRRASDVGSCFSFPRGAVICSIEDEDDEDEIEEEEKEKKDEEEDDEDAYLERSKNVYSRKPLPSSSRGRGRGRGRWGRSAIPDIQSRYGNPVGKDQGNDCILGKRMARESTESERYLRYRRRRASLYTASTPIVPREYLPPAKRTRSSVRSIAPSTSSAVAKPAAPVVVCLDSSDDSKGSAAIKDRPSVGDCGASPADVDSSDSVKSVDDQFVHSISSAPITNDASKKKSGSTAPHQCVTLDDIINRILQQTAMEMKSTAGKRKSGCVDTVSEPADDATQGTQKDRRDRLVDEKNARNSCEKDKLGPDEATPSVQVDGSTASADSACGGEKLSSEPSIPDEECHGTTTAPSSAPVVSIFKKMEPEGPGQNTEPANEDEPPTAAANEKLSDELSTHGPANRTPGDSLDAPGDGVVNSVIQGSPDSDAHDTSRTLLGASSDNIDSIMQYSPVASTLREGESRYLDQNLEISNDDDKLPKCHTIAASNDACAEEKVSNEPSIHALSDSKMQHSPDIHDISRALFGVPEDCLDSLMQHTPVSSTTGKEDSRCLDQVMEPATDDDDNRFGDGHTTAAADDSCHKEKLPHEPPIHSNNSCQDDKSSNEDLIHDPSNCIDTKMQHPPDASVGLEMGLGWLDLNWAPTSDADGSANEEGIDILIESGDENAAWKDGYMGIDGNPSVHQEDKFSNEASIPAPPQHDSPREEEHSWKDDKLGPDGEPKIYSGPSTVPADCAWEDDKFNNEASTTLAPPDHGTPREEEKFSNEETTPDPPNHETPAEEEKFSNEETTPARTPAPPDFDTPRAEEKFNNEETNPAPPDHDTTPREGDKCSNEDPTPTPADHDAPLEEKKFSDKDSTPAPPDHDAPRDEESDQKDGGLGAPDDAEPSVHGSHTSTAPANCACEEEIFGIELPTPNHNPPIHDDPGNEENLYHDHSIPASGDEKRNRGEENLVPINITNIPVDSDETMGLQLDSPVASQGGDTDMYLNLEPERGQYGDTEAVGSERGENTVHSMSSSSNHDRPKGADVNGFTNPQTEGDRASNVGDTSGFTNSSYPVDPECELLPKILVRASTSCGSSSSNQEDSDQASLAASFSNSSKVNVMREEESSDDELVVCSGNGALVTTAAVDHKPPPPAAATAMVVASCVARRTRGQLFAGKLKPVNYKKFFDTKEESDEDDYCRMLSTTSLSSMSDSTSTDFSSEHVNGYDNPEELRREDNEDSGWTSDDALSLDKESGEEYGRGNKKRKGKKKTTTTRTYKKKATTSDPKKLPTKRREKDVVPNVRTKETTDGTTLCHPYESSRRGVVPAKSSQPRAKRKRRKMDMDKNQDDGNPDLVRIDEESDSVSSFSSSSIAGDDPNAQAVKEKDKARKRKRSKRKRRPEDRAAGRERSSTRKRKGDQKAEEEELLKKFMDGVSVEDKPDEQVLAAKIDPVWPSLESLNAGGEILPLLFSFHDDDPKPPEKIEQEKFAEELWGDYELAMGSYHKSAFDNNKGEEEPPLPNDSDELHSSVPCVQENHCFVLDDEYGIVCKFCGYVKLKMKDILPNFATNSGIHSRAHYHDKQDAMMLDQLVVNASGNSFTNLSHLSTGTVWDLIPGTKDTMYPHQQDGFEFMWRNLTGDIFLHRLKETSASDDVGGCVISHAPGTGKTRLAIVFLESFMMAFPNSRPVIMAPRGMLTMWEKEFGKWNVKTQFHLLNRDDSCGGEDAVTGRGRSRNTWLSRLTKLCKWIKGQGVLGISYGLFERLVNQSSKKTAETAAVSDVLVDKPGLFIFDEGHTPRNSRSNIWKTLEKIKTERRIILSGTPFQNNFGELYNTLCLVRPKFARNITVTGQKLKRADGIPMPGSSATPAQEKDDGRGKWTSLTSTINNDSLEQLRSMIRPFVHVHNGSILKSLPGLRESLIILNLNPQQKAIVDRIEESSIDKTFALEYKISLTAIHPSLSISCGLSKEEKVGIDEKQVLGQRLNPDDGAKTRFVVELITLCGVFKEKVLIFSQFIEPLSLIKDQLISLFSWAEGRQILQMDGKIQLKHRQSSIDQFNDPTSEVRVLLASTKACCEGISLTGASRVVLLDVVWNPSVENQAISRAFRIGQEKVVHTYHLIAADTREVDKYDTQAKKEHISKLVFSSSTAGRKNGQEESMGDVILDDRILEEMKGRDSLRDMFKQVVYRPKANFNLLGDC